EIDDRFNAQLLYEEFRIAREILEPIQLFEWAIKIRNEESRIVSEEVRINNRNDFMSDETRRIYDRLFNRTGEILEKEGLYAEALEMYEQSQLQKNRERMIRIC